MGLLIPSHSWKWRQLENATFNLNCNKSGIKCVFSPNFHTTFRNVYRIRILIQTILKILVAKQTYKYYKKKYKIVLP
jgi:hypothetical protein